MLQYDEDNYDTAIITETDYVLEDRPRDGEFLQITTVDYY